MIIGSLKDTQRIASFHPLFKTLFDFLANNDLSNIQLGKTELLKNKLYIICSTLEKGASREQLLEGHRKYIDVHILLEGKETIGWTPLCKALCKHKALHSGVQPIVSFPSSGICTSMYFL